jgi:hypothetical protein
LITSDYAKFARIFLFLEVGNFFLNLTKSHKPTDKRASRKSEIGLEQGILRKQTPYVDAEYLLNPDKVLVM